MKISTSLADQKQTTSAVTALNVLENLGNNCILLCEAHLCSSECFSAMLLAASHKQIKVREAAEAAVLSIAQKIR